ncbi:MAG: hypothetical protein AAF797_12350 [Planctomycetota bacterium]
MLHAPICKRLRPLRRFFIGAAAIAMVGLGAHAHADSVWLAGNGGLKDSYFGKLGDGLTVTITAGNYANNAYRSAKVGQYSNGLGVTNPTSGDSHMVDGYGSDDILWFTFNHYVTLKGFSFSYVDWNDDAKLLDGDKDTLEKFDVKSSVWFSDGFYGKTFGLKAYGGNDEFKVKKLKYHYTPIPTPSAALAGALSMGLLALRRRRKTNDN